MGVELKVIICRQPGDNCRGELAVNQIRNVHWSNISGGIQRKQGAYYLYGYIPYHMAMDLVACSGSHEHFHGDAKICICKKYNIGEYQAGYCFLARMAGDKPTSIVSECRPTGQPPCTKKIIELLNGGSISRGELRAILLQIGYHSTTILSAIKSLLRKQKIVCSGSASSPKQVISRNKLGEID